MDSPDCLTQNGSLTHHEPNDDADALNVGIVLCGEVTSLGNVGQKQEGEFIHQNEFIIKQSCRGYGIGHGCWGCNEHIAGAARLECGYQLLP